jgi:hypothetical protein
MTDLHRSEVNSLVKSKDTGMDKTLHSIYSIDNRISAWWFALPDAMRLVPAGIPQQSAQTIPNLVLLNMVYHQCLCALHASIVPLFCWTASEKTWTSARQASAQGAYEHASAASVLLDAFLNSGHNLSATPSFVAYAAYSGCAIQIPFIWSGNAAVKQRAKKNVKTNVRYIQVLAKYWKFTALLVSPRICLVFTRGVDCPF